MGLITISKYQSILFRSNGQKTIFVILKMGERALKEDGKKEKWWREYNRILHFHVCLSSNWLKQVDLVSPQFRLKSSVTVLMIEARFDICSYGRLNTVWSFENHPPEYTKQQILSTAALYTQHRCSLRMCTPVEVRV